MWTKYLIELESVEHRETREIIHIDFLTHTTFTYTGSCLGGMMCKKRKKRLWLNANFQSEAETLVELCNLKISFMLHHVALLNPLMA